MIGVAALLAAAMLQPETPPRVTVTGGVVEGSRARGGGLLFRGIPFAAPPLDALRWRAPLPVAPWQGVRADNPDAPACLQNDHGWNHGDLLRQSEDCLTLDVRTDGLKGRRPVMVWIHGGSNRAGSARGTVLSPIGKGQVVLVAIQYRLGILGFLPHRGAAAEARGTAGNYGLMDQLAALEWVRDNIARFGGDPANVTLFGESAGAQDVSLMLAAPRANGLFAKAILQSGTPGFGMSFRTIAEGFAIGDQADRLLGTGGSIAELRRRPAQALLEADGKLADGALLSNDFLWLRTTIDGAVLPRSPRELLAEAPVRPVILGTNRVEFGPGPGEVDWPAQLRHIFGTNAERAREFYRGDGPRMATPEKQFWTDWIFRCPAGRLADLLSARGAPVWRYEWDYAEKRALTAHAAEIPWVLGGKTFAGGQSLARYWVNFAATGDPGSPRWLRYDASEQRHILFDRRGASQDSRLREPICAMLEAL